MQCECGDYFTDAIVDTAGPENETQERPSEKHVLRQDTEEKTGEGES